MPPAGDRQYDDAIDDLAYNDPTYATNSAVSYATAQGHQGHTPTVHYQSTTPLYLESDTGSESTVS